MSVKLKNTFQFSVNHCFIEPWMPRENCREQAKRKSSPGATITLRVLFKQKKQKKKKPSTGVLLTALPAGYCYQKLLWAVPLAGCYSRPYQQTTIPWWWLPCDIYLIFSLMCKILLLIEGYLGKTMTIFLKEYVRSFSWRFKLRLQDISN